MSRGNDFVAARCLDLNGGFRRRVMVPGLNGLVLFVADNAVRVVARDFDALAAGRRVRHLEKLVGGNRCAMIEAQEPAVLHRHVHGHDEVALRDDHGREWVILYGRAIFLYGYFGLLRDAHHVGRTGTSRAGSGRRNRSN